MQECPVCERPSYADGRGLKLKAESRGELLEVERPSYADGRGLKRMLLNLIPAALTSARPMRTGED